MILGPGEIIRCPFCNAAYLMQTLVSGNTFGGMCFSDGQHFYPMLPETPQITRCDTCLNFFWLEDIPVVENTPENSDGVEFPYVRWPSAEEYAEMLSLHFYRNAEEEVYLRMHLWWVFNNRLRGEQKRAGTDHPSTEPFYEENLKAILRLKLVEEPKDFLMLAEIHRELGLFDEALDLLKRNKVDNLKDVARQIKEKIIQKDRYAFMLK